MESRTDINAKDKEEINELKQLGLDYKKLRHLININPLPGVVFAMRYPDDTGFVWNTIACARDLAAGYLSSTAKCFIAYPELSGNPAYRAKHLHPVALDFHDTSAQALAKQECFIKENSIKVVVFMSALPSTLNLRFFKRLGVSTVNTENDGFNHSQTDPTHIRLLKFIARRVLKKQVHDIHLANAEAQFNFLLNYAQVPRSRLALMRDAVDHNRFVPGASEEACNLLKLDSDRLWVISVAQARPEKRVDFVIRAVKEAIKARPDQKIGFLFVGDGECIPEWKQTARELLLEEQFHFAGRQDNLLPYYQAASVMAHASKRESFGLAIVEAMSCGLPVVATNSAGPCETIEDGNTGTLVSPDDLHAMAAALLRYIDSKDLRSSHGTAARQRVMKFYGINRQSRDLADQISRFLPS